ncbi:MAG: hypothetical protein RBQ97_03670 [Acholeplasma sp.]|nr:hypothetical protein [Acholeplasma sp.]
MATDKKKTKSDFQFSGKSYVVIPNVIFDNPNISATTKIVASIIHSFNYEWNVITTKALASMVKLSVRTIQYSISEAIDNKIIDVKKVGKKRFFKSLINKLDTKDKALIPSDILANPDVDSSYKLTYGVLAYKGLNVNGGYDFENVSNLALELNLSLSSVYRHINYLIGSKSIIRVNRPYFFSCQDKYSQTIYKSKQRALKEQQAKQASIDDYVLDPFIETKLEKIFKNL